MRRTRRPNSARRPNRRTRLPFLFTLSTLPILALLAAAAGSNPPDLAGGLGLANVRPHAASALATEADSARPDDLRPCAGRGELSYAHKDPDAGLAADPEGHFALYTAPDSATGRPRPDSHPVLRGCGHSLSEGNSAAVRLATPDGMTSSYGGAFAESPGEVYEAARAHLTDPTRPTGPATLQTNYAFPDGTTLTQTLDLLEPDAATAPQWATGIIEISYTIRNGSDSPRNVGLRSMLSPVSTGSPPFYVPALEDLGPVRGGAGGAIDNERVLMVTHRPVPPFAVYGASSPAAYWTADAATTPPDRVTFAGRPRFFEKPFVYDIRPGWPLPQNPSFAIHWLDRPLGPGESTTFSHLYAFQPPER